MPLTIYRRHRRACAFYGKSRKARNNSQCKARCPIWVQGTLRGEKVWRSLSLNDWSAAADLIRSWEASGEIGVVKPDTPSPELAVERFFEDAIKAAQTGNHFQVQPAAPEALAALLREKGHLQAESARRQRTHPIPCDVG